MAVTIYYFVAGAIVLGLIPLVPQLVRLRIRALRFIHWQRLANWHERNFDVLVVAVRIIMAVIGIIVISLGFESL